MSVPGTEGSSAPRAERRDRRLGWEQFPRGLVKPRPGVWAPALWGWGGHSQCFQQGAMWSRLLPKKGLQGDKTGVRDDRREVGWVLGGLISSLLSLGLQPEPSGQTHGVQGSGDGGRHLGGHSTYSPDCPSLPAKPPWIWIFTFLDSSTRCWNPAEPLWETRKHH